MWSRIVVIVAVSLRCSAIASAGAPRQQPAADPESAGAKQEPKSIWALTAHLTTAQRATNDRIYATLPADDCDPDNVHDARAKILAEKGRPEAVKALYALARSGEREAQAAGGRALVFLAQQASRRRDFATAGQHALNIYLSGTPHRVRMEALRVWCRAGDPQRSAQVLRLIEQGRQDALFQPMLEELRSARQLRVDELRAAVAPTTTPPAPETP